jgi:glycosyltransferase involved in cell wall biosynthesis
VFLSDIDEAIAELYLLVHASITGEPFGQVIIEGMAAGGIHEGHFLFHCIGRYN